MKPGWLIWTVLIFVAVIAGYVIGYNARANSVNDRYIRSLAEKHEAATRYWDTQTNEIISNNTLERKRRDAKH